MRMDTVYYPLTHAQKRVFYTERFYPGTSVSNLGGFAKLRSESGLKPSLIVDVFQEYVRRTDSLRLRLVYRDAEEEPVQYIKAYEKMPIQIVKGWSKDDVTAWANEQIRQPMELIESCLIEFTVFQMSDEECWLFCKAHHIIADGISIILMGNNLMNLYHEMLHGVEVSELEQISFVDHIVSEETYESSKRFQKDKAFWNRQFAEIPENSSLKPHQDYQLSLNAERFSKNISTSLKERLRDFCEEQNISMLAFFLSALYIYLYRLTGRDDVVLGTFMGNRTNAKEKKMVGMFVSTIPMRAKLDGSNCFISFVKEVMADQMRVLRHQKYPYNLLMNDLREREGYTSRLFDISLEYQVMQWQKKENLSFITEPIFGGSGMNDISIHVKDRWDTDTLTIDLDYRTDLFSHEEMALMFERLTLLMEDAVAHPNRSIGTLSFLTENEKAQVLHFSKKQPFSLPPTQVVHHLFDDIAAQHSDRLAVVADDGKRTYGQLHADATMLARLLQSKGVAPGVPVAILTDRSVDAMIAIFGVLKAGGAYVPIDPALPEERIQYILQDSGALAVLTDGLTARRYPFLANKALVLEDVLTTELSLPELTHDVSHHDLAYMIYTSGTTGKPKGVMIEHCQLHHLVHALHHEVYAGASHLNMAVLAPFHFDASVKQIFVALLYGHTLYIVPREVTKNGVHLAAYFREHQIEATDGTPAHVQLLLAAESFEGLALTHMLIGGEALPKKAACSLIEAVHVKQPNFTLFNVYGPTETCVDATVHRVDLNELQQASEQRYVSIGQPLGHHRIYILNEYDQLQAEGVVGELCIAGKGVGRGYLHQPDLTKEAFTTDPFVSNERMYRTGDLARWLPDGTIDYLGRKDDQVKVRGYRIETGEIEAVLEQVDGVEKAIVLVLDEADGEKAIRAYYQANDQGVSVQTLQAQVKSQLPEYMMPLYFTEVDTFPLTISGKVDRHALATLKVEKISTTAYVAPRNETEAQLIHIWTEVLDHERIGVYDSFFDLGGHSLKAMKLLTSIQRTFHIDVPLSFLFEQQTVAALADYIDHADSISDNQIEKAPNANDYPLSPAQQRVYMVSQFDHSTAYNMPAVVRIEGELQHEQLAHAFHQLIARHDVLRTSFLTIKGIPRQRVAQSVQFEMELMQGGTIEESMTQFVRPFDLERAPLLRIGMRQMSDQEHLLFFDMHHLISDGMSIDLMLSELSDDYQGHQRKAPPLQYQDYAVWQQQQADGGYKKEETYWIDQFSGEIPVLQLLTDFQRPAVQSFEGDRVTEMVDGALKQRLQELAKRQHTTLYTVLLSAYYTLLAKYTGQEDFVVGTPVAGRVHPDLHEMLGMFVNTLALRSQVHQDASFVQLLDQVKETTVQAFDNQQYPFERLIEQLHVQRDFSRNPLFDTVFTIMSDDQPVQYIGDMKVAVEETNFHIAKFDLTLQAVESSDHLSFMLDYSTALFKRGTAEQILSHYVYLLEQIATAPNEMLRSYRLLSEEDATAQLQLWNPLPTPYPKEETIVQQFEAQVEQHLTEPALQFKSTVLSYQELNQRVNQLARHLQAAGFEKGMKAALFFERSEDMVISVLAALKAGGAYVPIDPDYPEERVKHFFTDSGAQFLLTHEPLRQRSVLAAFHGTIIETGSLAISQEAMTNIDVNLFSEDLANLTYTSGTTGMPKGNMVTHRNIIRTVKQSNYLTITKDDTVMSISNYVFDAFMFDLFGALLNGAKLVVLPKDDVLNMNVLTHAIEEEQVSILMITTALFHLLIDMKKDSLKNVRKVLFGGERASVPHVTTALSEIGKGRLLHMYGPSESTIFTTYYPVDDIEENTVSIPIGKPVSQTAVYILNEAGHVQPPGVAGELCVSGEGLVKGYYGQPELTEEKFVDHPFRPGEKMYRTGDLARWLLDGRIEFIGRLDHQVKIRGQRIELGEIEHQLLRHPHIKEAVVLAISLDALCAYVTADRELSHSELREHTSLDLPSYMVPSVFIQLEELPLTGNGKVDRRALPAPDHNLLNQKEYKAPQTETERVLASIWTEVLEIPKISKHDHFFDSGGHSLSGMKMLNMLYEQLQVELSLKALFQAPTLEAFAKLIDRAEQGEVSTIPQVPKQAFYPVTSGQKRLFVLQQLEHAQKSYNMPAILRLEGLFDEHRFAGVLDQLVKRHEALRTSFDLIDGEIVQRIEEQVKVEIEHITQVDADIDQLMAQFIRPFDLAKAPLIRIGLMRKSAEVHYLFIDMHHIISDGASVSILIDELSELYSGKQLPSLPIQYKDYAVWTNNGEQFAQQKKQEAFWLEHLNGELPVLALPEDKPRPSVQTFEGDRLQFAIDGELKQRLDHVARSLNSTAYTLLLACYSTLLSKLSRQEDIIIGSPIVGRVHSQVQPVIGMFVNTLAIRTKPKGSATFAGFVEHVKQIVLEAYENQSYPFEQLVDQVQTVRDTSRNPIFDVVFSMENADLRDVKMDGLQILPQLYEEKTAKFDLTLTGLETTDQIEFVFDFNTSIFKKETVMRWKAYFLHLLAQVLTDPHVKLAEAQLLPKEKQAHLLAEWNGPVLDVPTTETVHALFEQQVARAPFGKAVSFNGISWSYEELNAKANQIANQLLTLGITQGDRVGILTHPSLEMTAAVLGVLKAGAAFVPIDPDYPEQRIAYILEDCG
ncbi:amino acid adenylation domain-containing protein, partial [Bacillus sp. NPDC077027]|uniref:non-ribosomal peptide synthetase n=1 Tax=Bacillus sp. NPDC077027 TaxID=3390548 RepID=UPI003CFBD02D